MKVTGIGPKLIDYAKRGACLVLVTLMIQISKPGVAETKKEYVSAPTKIEYRIPYDSKTPISVGEHAYLTMEDGENAQIVLSDSSKLEETLEPVLEGIDLSSVSSQPVFIMYGCWTKSKNYSVGKGYAKDNREYERTVYYFTPNKDYNPEYFDGDYEKILRFFRDNEHAKEIFEVLSRTKEVIQVSPQEEQELDTTHTILEVEGSPISIKIFSRSEEKKLQEEEKAETRKGFIIGGAAIALLIVDRVWRYKKYGVMGWK